MEDMQNLDDIAPAGSPGLQAADSLFNLQPLGLLHQHHYVGAWQPPGFLVPREEMR